jgi:hypothetical protein
MFPLSRRDFLYGSMAAMAAGSLTSAARAEIDFEATPFVPSTLFLTWQRDPTTTMTVQWVGTIGETSDNTIRYLPAKEAKKDPKQHWNKKSPAAKPFPKSDFKVFRAELTGLTPDTDYQFRVGRNSPTYSFRTMPAKATDAISFISGGDCGINSHAIANNIQAARQDPSFAVIGGDLAYENAQSVEIMLAFLRNYSRHMVGRGGRMIPLIPAIGNHEVEGMYGQPRRKAPFFYSLFDGLFPETGFATLDFGDYLSLVLLDTDHTSPIGGLQTQWLEKTLAERKDHPHVFIVNHVPAYPSFRSMAAAGKEKSGTGEGNRKHWVPLFEKYRVPVVLEHHDHTFKRTKPLINGLANDNGVLYLGDGSWGRLRAPQKPEKLPFLAASSQDYHLSLHRLEGNDRTHLALDENGRVMDIGRSGQRRSGVFAAAQPVNRVVAPPAPRAPEPASIVPTLDL